ncbi:DUF2254 family protein [Asaia sp. HN010]|uniref:DUF2254 family protein n=1 Tax=Asaia sp. HN010 TaxID=3081233 RepID=UPI00301B634A
MVRTARSFDQDPRFGLITLAEVALRALSPAVNDPGTAIDVIGRETRLLTTWYQAQADRGRAELADPRLSVRPITCQDLFEDAFNLIGRDGAAQIDIMLRLVKSLAALGRIGTAESRRAADHQLQLAYERAMESVPIADDRARLSSAASRLRLGLDAQDR